VPGNKGVLDYTSILFAYELKITLFRSPASNRGHFKIIRRLFREVWNQLTHRQHEGSPVENNPTANRLLTTKEAAALLKISVCTLLRWVNAGELRAVRLSRRVIRFEAETLHRWVRLHNS
jgi:excisionase family DNA binding protein